MRLHPWPASADHTTFVFRSFLFLYCSWPIAFVFVKAFSRDQDILSSHGGTRYWDVGMVRLDPPCGHLQNVSAALVLWCRLLILVGLLAECCWDHSRQCWQMIISWRWRWLVQLLLLYEWALTVPDHIHSPPCSSQRPRPYTNQPHRSSPQLETHPRRHQDTRIRIEIGSRYRAHADDYYLGRQGMFIVHVQPTYVSCCWSGDVMTQLIVADWVWSKTSWSSL